ncbi:MAG TPA: antibiotic biosynthesis monooxygenase family protein [Pyrinomonadaceae bacterium]|nr:antibiotic biosynthesis monooxygenase family protein [Pyrinomonadaceae bacterium]
MFAPGEKDAVVTAATIIVRPENRKELCLTVASLLNPIRQEPGCVGYRFYGEAGDENSFLLIGEWETRDALNRHLESNNFAVLMGSMMLLGKVSTVDFKLLRECSGRHLPRSIRSEMKEALCA